MNGSGAVALATNTGGAKGRLSFQPGTSLSFASTNNSLTINGETFTLENSVATLAGAITANPAGNFALSNSYDASRDGRYRRSPVGTTLTGKVEGLGNAISHLSIATVPTITPPHGTSEVGLFAEIGYGGVVSNLELANFNYRLLSGGCVAGGLAGTNGGYVENDYASGSIRSGSATKGFLEWIGGLVGFNDNVISSSHASVGIISPGYATLGGLTARNFGTIALSSATGSVEGKSGPEYVGGLVGENYGTIAQSFASGRVSDRKGSDLGGLVGANFMGDGPYIENSYATGAVKGDGSSEVGGFVGDGDFEEFNQFDCLFLLHRPRFEK